MGALLAEAQEAHKGPAFTSGEVANCFLIVLLSSALLILVLNSWTIIRRLTEIRDLLREGDVGSATRVSPPPVTPRPQSLSPQ